MDAAVILVDANQSLEALYRQDSDQLWRSLARQLERAFPEHAMGTATSLEAASQGLLAAGYSLERLPSWPDVDTVDDLRRLAESFRPDADAPRTAAWLRDHALDRAGPRRA